MRTMRGIGDLLSMICQTASIVIPTASCYMMLTRINYFSDQIFSSTGPCLVLFILSIEGCLSYFLRTKPCLY